MEEITTPGLIVIPSDAMNARVASPPADFAMLDEIVMLPSAEYTAF